MKVPISLLVLIHFLPVTWASAASSQEPSAKQCVTDALEDYAAALAVSGMDAEAQAAHIRQVATALLSGEAKKTGTVVRKWREGELVKYRDEFGDEVLAFDRRKDGKIVSREVAFDADTGKILRGTKQGNQVAELTILHAAADAHKVSSAGILVDVNFLGQTNYFRKGMTAGNAVLNAVADEIGPVIRSSLREDDLIFRYGGDEFFAHVDRVTPEETHRIAQRINEAVAKSEKARQVFRDQRLILAAEYRAIYKARSIQDIAPEIRDHLTPEAIELARSSFLTFRKQFLEAQLKQLQALAKLRPSVSVGSTMVRPEDTLDTVIERTSQQIKTVKARFKQGLGLDAEKYGGAGSGQVKTLPKVPEVLPPS